MSTKQNINFSKIFYFPSVNPLKICPQNSILICSFFFFLTLFSSFFYFPFFLVSFSPLDNQLTSNKNHLISNNPIGYNSCRVSWRIFYRLRFNKIREQFLGPGSQGLLAKLEQSMPNKCLTKCPKKQQLLIFFLFSIVVCYVSSLVEVDNSFNSLIN